MQIPTRAECLALLARKSVPEHVIAHSMRVTQVAVFLAHALNQRGNQLDLALVEAGGLLHDIAKISALKNKEDHASAGARILHAHGFHDVAEIVRQHIRPDARAEDGPATECEIVFYADKRVCNDRIVLLAERLDDLKMRYGHTPERACLLAEYNKIVMLLEARLFAELPFAPDLLNSLNLHPPDSLPLCLD